MNLLVICVGNTARSQMAAAYFRKYGSDVFDEVESAGLKPGILNPYAVKAMALDGIDISKAQPKSVQSLWERGHSFTYVIAVCSKDAAVQCPVFPCQEKVFHWPFPDPAGLTGSTDEILSATVVVRDEIKKKILSFLELYRNDSTLALAKF
ncbi:MAG: arsenate reductase ArsC [Spirochaetia bacterium]|jgi:arsenate reductase|nr:arsenate reductase ArsC [Spirochaetia bacterium]